jgi:hypothetical protein
VTSSKPYSLNVPKTSAVHRSLGPDVDKPEESGIAIDNVPPQARTDRRSVIEAQILAATEQLLREGENVTDLGVQRIAAAAGVAPLRTGTAHPRAADAPGRLAQLVAVSRERQPACLVPAISAWETTICDIEPRSSVARRSRFRHHSCPTVLSHTSKPDRCPSPQLHREEICLGHSARLPPGRALQRLQGAGVVDVDDRVELVGHTVTALMALPLAL